MRGICFIVISALLASLAAAEWYSTLGHIEDLMEAKMKLISSLRVYISAEETKLEKLKSIVTDVKIKADEARQNADKYLGHPVNQYLLVKRFWKEWDSVNYEVTMDVSIHGLMDMMEKHLDLPANDDVKETVTMMIRLQDTYDLDTRELADGIIRNSSAGQTLSADDCFEIGQLAFQEQDFYRSTLWLSEADHRIMEGDESHGRFEVLDYLSDSLYNNGDLLRAYQTTKELMLIDSYHGDHHRENLNFYKSILNYEIEQGETYEGRPIPPGPRQATLYQRLCRDGGDPVPPHIEKKLKCYLWDNHRNPSLLYRPIKMEELWRSPHLVRFYDIVSNYEINELKAMAKHEFAKAQVTDPQTGETLDSQVRVGETAFFQDDESYLVSRLSKRVGAITGLSMETAEQLQMASYGTGGLFEPHYDFLQKQQAQKVSILEADRIATMLFYFQDIEYGGATVFLIPKIAVQPVKGSAVFWYNMYPSGDGDINTEHAGCPVLMGTKLIANKWMHEQGQEFRRRCALKQNARNHIF